MSLNVTSGILKIDGDTSGAVTALNDVKTKSSELEKGTASLGGSFGSLITKFAPMAAGGAALGAAFMVAKESFNQFNDASKASADLFSQFGDQSWLAATKVNKLTDAVDNMIKVQTMAAAYNQLVRSDIGATEGQLSSLSKAAVELGRSSGRAADDVLRELSDAVATGQTNAFRRYGIIVNEGKAIALANKAALQEFGREANELEKKNAKTKVLLEEVDKRYKNVLISAGDVNEIEAKYQNTKAKNMALVAKTMENTAKSIQEVRHGFENAKQEVVGFLNGLDKLDDRARTALTQGLAKQTDEAVTLAREQMSKITGETAPEQEKIVRFYQDKNKHSKEELKTLKEMKTLSADKEKSMMKELAANQKSLDQAKATHKANETALQLAKATLEDVGVSNSGYAKHARELAHAQWVAVKEWTKESEKALKLEEEKLKIRQDLVAGLDVDKSLGATDKLLLNIVNSQTVNDQIIKTQMDASKKILEDASKLTVLDADTVSKAKMQKETMIATYETRRQMRIAAEAEVASTEAILSAGKKLGTEKENQYKLQKDMIAGLKKEEEGILGILGSLLKLQMGIKPPPTSTPTGQAQAWESEYNKIVAVIKRGNEDANKAIQEKFGSLDKNVIKQKLRDQYNEVLKTEKQFIDERIAQLRAGSESQIKDLEDIGHEQVEGVRRTITEMVSAEEEYAEKMNNLHEKELSESKRIAKLKGLNDKETLRKELNDGTEAITVKSEQILRLKMLLNSDIVQRDEYAEERKKIADKIKKLEADVTAAEETQKDKRVEIKLKEQSEVKAVYDRMQSDIKSYGEQLIKSGAGALYDAVTIEKAALKESTMSRSEMLKKALKEEMANIAKTAAVQAIFQTAMGLAALAVGSPTSGAHFASAAAYGLVAGTALSISKSVSAPSDASIAERKAKRDEEEKKKEQGSQLANSSASVSGASGSGSRVINIYWPAGMFIGDKDDIVKVLKVAEDEADRRGK